MVPHLLAIFNKCFENGVTPYAWSDSTMVVIPKEKGDPLVPPSWREISKRTFYSNCRDQTLEINEAKTKAMRISAGGHNMKSDKLRLGGETNQFENSFQDLVVVFSSKAYSFTKQITDHVQRATGASSRIPDARGCGLILPTGRDGRQMLDEAPTNIKKPHSSEQPTRLPS